MTMPAIEALPTSWSNSARPRVWRAARRSMLRCRSSATVPPGRELAPRTRGFLQSDAPPARTPGQAGFGDGPDAFDATRDNPHLPMLMRAAGVTIDNIRKHGSKTFNVLPNLRELADATNQRTKGP